MVALHKTPGQPTPEPWKILLASIVLHLTCLKLHLATCNQGKTVMHTIERLQNQSLLCTPLPPQTDYGANQYPQIMSWLDYETVNRPFPNYL